MPVMANSEFSTLIRLLLFTLLSGHLGEQVVVETSFEPFEPRILARSKWVLRQTFYMGALCYK